MFEFDPILVHEWLRRSARRFPDKEALICGQQRWTYKTLDEHTDHLAAALLAQGLNRGDRVVILFDNSAETVISLYGTLKAGGTFVVLASSLKGPKLKYILENSGAETLITHTSKAKVVVDALSDRPAGSQTLFFRRKAGLRRVSSRKGGGNSCQQ